ncbi:hypothetical protein [uncultured Aquitalea sp.]|uniref:hypothetical protein n=1 Tax=uncultured Aquitalea sp. TaxID=540272 RepID=UPI0025E8D58A|nr:hypothetical protein [uncultured Aquitalea sp.]
MTTSNPTPSKVVTVMPVGMDPRKLSVFRMAFRMHHSHQHFQLMDEAPGFAPDLAIVDVDSVEGWGAWDSFRERHPQLPALIVTTTPPADAPAAVIRKPVRVETLFPQMRQLLNNERDVTPPVLRPAVKEAMQQAAALAAASERQSAPQPEEDVAVLERPVAPPPAPKPEPVAPRMEAQRQQAQAPVAAPVRVNFERFDPQAGLFGLLVRLYRLRGNAVITLNEEPLLVIQPAQDRALLLQPLTSLQALCELPSSVFGQQPCAEPPAVFDSEVKLQNLVWQIAIWSSKGRLMRGMSTETPLRLRYWPNLTRLPPIPDAIRITAFLTKTPVNLKLITHMLKVPPESLFSFLAAAWGVGILDMPLRSGTLSVISTEPVRPGARPPAAEALPETPKIVAAEPVAAPTPAPSPIAAPASRPQSGLLSRLLKKVIGL